MLHFIIFSYNRAAQLDLLLKTLYEHNTITCNISVIYNSSNSFYEKGYEILKKKYSKPFFLKEGESKHNILNVPFNYFNIYHYLKYSYLRKSKTNFKSLLENIIKNCNNKFVVFLTDDAIFYNKITLNPAVLNLLETKVNQYSFSFRLGYKFGSAPTKNNNRKDIFTWNFYSNNGTNKDWHYPFSLDGHVYEKNYLKDILRKVFYCNPNSLEQFMVKYIRKRNLYKYGICNENPVYINIPINMVQAIHSNKSLKIEPNFLNKHYLNDYEILYALPDNISYSKVYPKNMYLVNYKTNHKIPVL